MLTPCSHERQGTRSFQTQDPNAKIQISWSLCPSAHRGMIIGGATSEKEKEGKKKKSQSVKASHREGRTGPTKGQSQSSQSQATDFKTVIRRPQGVGWSVCWMPRSQAWAGVAIRRGNRIKEESSNFFPLTPDSQPCLSFVHINVPRRDF